MLFTKPKKSIGVDIGSHSVKTVLMGRAGRGLRVEQVGYGVVDRNMYNQDPLAAQADALVASLQGMPTPRCLLVGALPGQTVVIRYPRFNDMPSAELNQAVEAEAGQNIPYDLSEVFLDWNLIDTYQEGDAQMLKVVLVAAKHEAIDARVQVAEGAGVQLGVLSVDSLALADAAESCNMLGESETVALINLGSSSTSIHFMRDGVSNFIRDVSWGSREFVTAVAKARRCEMAEAEKMLADFAREGGMAAAMPEPESEPEPAQPAPDAGANLLDPLDDELGSMDALGDLSGSPEPTPAPAPSTSGPGSAGGADTPIAALLDQPLQRLVTEVRRSFDFYEQQLYERPVDRIILSGGVANIPLIAKTMSDELEIADISVANPAEGGVTLGNDSSIRQLHSQPHQFMVAIGLAARGMSEL